MMKHFKDPQTNQIFGYESDGSQDEFIRPGLVPISDAEADTIRAGLIVQHRADVIRARLAEIDALSVRALRATVAAQGKGRQVPAYDMDKLDALEVEAAALRQELAAL